MSEKRQGTWTGNLQTKYKFTDADIKQWWKLRAGVRKHAKRCAFCKTAFGADFPIVDHIKPHRGDVTLFLDALNLQPLCVTCHNKRKQVIEINEHKPVIGLDGWTTV